MLVTFFDLDDTLVNHSWAEQRAAVVFFGHVAERTSATSAEHFVRDWDVAKELHIQRFLSGELTFQGQRRERVRAVIRGNVSDQEADAIISDYLKHYEAGWRCYSDVVPCLDALGGMSAAVLTNGDPEQQAQKLARTGLAERFSAVIASGGVGHAKPDPRIFQIACERMGVQPSDAVHIGDSTVSDYEGASTAGLRAILLDRNGDATCGSDVVVVRSLTEVPSVIASF